MADEIKYIDKSQKLFRESAPLRIGLGTLSTFFIGSLFSISVSNYRNLSNKYIKNWMKGSLFYSFGFFTLNELFVFISKHNYIYTNYFINYSLSGYLMSKHHINYMIRKNGVNWHEAILFSQKCFLFLVIFSVLFELNIEEIRDYYLNHDENILDIIKISHDQNRELTVEELRNMFDITSFKVLPHQEEFLKDSLVYKGNVKYLNLYDLYKKRQTQNKI